MLRPKSISPNTMVPIAQGMDYYLLPDSFQDCLDDAGHSTLTKERDAWFAASPKYGQAYLDGIKRQSAAGIRVIPQFSTGSQREERYREPFDAGFFPVGATQRGRSAATMDQLSRAGLTEMSVGGFSSMRPSMGNGFPVVGRMDIGAMIGMPGVSAGPGVVSTSRAMYGSDYDTEDESLERGKRRRVSGSTKENASTWSSKGRILGVSLSSSPIKEPSQLVKLEMEPQIKVEASSPPATAFSGKDTHSNAPLRKPFKPFAVNKEHLRALAMVAAEVDDL